MKFWFGLSFLPAADLVRVAQQAERAGFDGVLANDHLGIATSPVSSYPYAKTKGVTVPAGTEWPDPLLALMAIAGATTTLRLSTHILIAPLWPAALLARAAGTLAILSNGRLDLGLGTGWMQEEYEACGVDFAARGRLMDDMIPAMRALLSDGPAARGGPIELSPRPPQPLRLLAGGHAERALRRAAAIADGWAGVDFPDADLLALVAKVRAYWAEAGQPTEGFECRGGVRGALTPERLRMLRDGGLDGVVVGPWQVAKAGVPVDALLAAIDTFGREIIAPFRIS
jgi:probable F420-dependent oxidoreductase